MASITESEMLRYIGRQPRHIAGYKQILHDLGVREMILLSNTRRTIIALEGYGLSVAGQRPIR